MKKFKFTLQTVHNVREMKREKEEFVLMQMRFEAEKILATLAQLEEKHRRAVENYTGKLGTGAAIHIGELELELNHISALEKTIRDTQAALERQQTTCTAQTAKVAGAMREVKITERLRETQASRHRLEAGRHEQNSLDELVVTGFARKMS